MERLLLLFRGRARFFRFFSAHHILCVLDLFNVILLILLNRDVHDVVLDWSISLQSLRNALGEEVPIEAPAVGVIGFLSERACWNVTSPIFLHSGPPDVGLRNPEHLVSIDVTLTLMKIQSQLRTRILRDELYPDLALLVHEA